MNKVFNKRTIFTAIILSFFLAVTQTASAAPYTATITIETETGEAAEGTSLFLTRSGLEDEYNLRYIAALDQSNIIAMEDYVLFTSPLPSFLEYTESLVASPAHQSQFGGLSNSSYVTAKYNTILGFPPSPSELTSWTLQLNAGMTRAEFIEEVIALGNEQLAWDNYIENWESDFFNSAGVFTTNTEGQIDFALDDQFNYAIRYLSIPDPYRFIETGNHTNAFGDPIPYSFHFYQDETIQVNKLAELKITIQNPTDNTVYDNVDIDVNGTTYTSNSDGAVNIIADQESGTFVITPLEVAGLITYESPQSIDYNLNTTFDRTFAYFKKLEADTTVDSSLLILDNEDTAQAVATTALSNYTINSSVITEYNLYGPFETNSFPSSDGLTPVATVIDSNSNLSGSTFNLDSGEVEVNEIGFYVWEVSTTLTDVGFGNQPTIIETTVDAISFEVVKEEAVKTFVNSDSLNFPIGSSGINSFNAEILNLGDVPNVEVEFEIFGPFNEFDDINDDSANLFDSEIISLTDPDSGFQTISSSDFTFSSPGIYAAKTTVSTDNFVTSFIDVSWDTSSSNAWFFGGENVVLRGFAFTRNGLEEELPVEGLTVEVSEENGASFGTFVTNASGFVTASVPSGARYCITPISVPETSSDLMGATNPLVHWDLGEIVAPNLIIDQAGNFDGVTSGQPSALGSFTTFDGENDEVKNQIGIPLNGGDFSVMINANFNPTSFNQVETLFSLHHEFLAGETVSLNTNYDSNINRNLVLDIFDEEVDLGLIGTGQDHIIILTHDASTGTYEVHLTAPEEGGVPSSIVGTPFSVDPEIFLGSFLNSQFFTGSVKDFAIYDRALDNNEIDDLFTIQDLPTLILDFSPKCTVGDLDFNMTVENAVLIPVFQDTELISTGFNSWNSAMAFGLLLSSLFLGCGFISKKELRIGIIK